MRRGRRRKRSGKRVRGGDEMGKRSRRKRRIDKEVRKWEQEKEEDR